MLSSEKEGAAGPKKRGLWAKGGSLFLGGDQARGLRHHPLDTHYAGAGTLSTVLGSEARDGIAQMDFYR